MSERNVITWTVSYPSWSRHSLTLLSATKSFNTLPDALGFVIVNYQNWKSGYSVFSVGAGGKAKQFFHSES